VEITKVVTQVNERKLTFFAKLSKLEIYGLDTTKILLHYFYDKIKKSYQLISQTPEVSC